MIDLDGFLVALERELLKLFGGRLLFLGLQGSRRRGEAAEGSDIDIVVVLDELGARDLLGYRRLIGALPGGELACGFISGRAQLESWPRHELFQFLRNTRPLYGELGPLLPPISRGDIIAAGSIAASGLYHAAAHCLAFERESSWPGALAALQKQAWFLLALVHYLRSGDYLDTRRALAPRLRAAERALVESPPADVAEGLARVLEYSGALLPQLNDVAAAVDRGDGAAAL